MAFAATAVELAATLPVAGIGSASRGAEAIATSVGAGVLLGGFLAGTLSLLGLGLRRSGRDGVADAGYLGGWVAVGCLLFDWAGR